MADKSYTQTRGKWRVTVTAKDGAEARYKIGAALDLFKRTGRKPSGAQIERA